MIKERLEAHIKVRLIAVGGREAIGLERGSPIGGVECRGDRMRQTERKLSIYNYMSALSRVWCKNEHTKIRFASCLGQCLYVLAAIDGYCRERRASCSGNLILVEQLEVLLIRKLAEIARHADLVAGAGGGRVSDSVVELSETVDGYRLSTAGVYTSARG